MNNQTCYSQANGQNAVIQWTVVIPEVKKANSKKEILGRPVTFDFHDVR
jgi:hypothetical protein